MKHPGKMSRVVIATAFTKPATHAYPAEKFEMPDKFRGKMIFTSERCIGCKACMRDCPSDAIHINKVADKVFEAEFDLDKCIYCAQCVDSCPKDAIDASKEFELAQLTRSKLKVVFHADPAKKVVPAPAPAAEPEKKIG